MSNPSLDKFVEKLETAKQALIDCESIMDDYGSYEFEGEISEAYGILADLARTIKLRHP